MNGNPTHERPEPLAIVAGVRTPFAKAFTALARTPADELGRVALTGVIERCGLKPDDVGEVIFGNVSGPAEASNVSRVIALRAGVPHDRPAHSVHRNCASGMESVFSAWHVIREGRAEIIAAGGTESMTNVPFLWSTEARDWFLGLRKAGFWKRLRMLAGVRSRFFKPIPGLELGLTDPVCGLNMGQTAEVLAKEFGVTREEQDAFALASHQKTAAAWERGFFTEEVVPVGDLDKDVGPRANQTMEALAKLKPLFDRESGTVTAGNSCPITDGAAALMVMSASKARSMGLTPLGYMRDYAVAGCDPRRMGLGPVFAIHRLLCKTGMRLSDYELFEINEAFAAQVESCRRALASESFAKTELNRPEAIGEIDPAMLNVNGGAVALGHPVGTSGTRLILTLLRAMREQGKRRGIASLCVGGGQGAAVWLETELDDGERSA